MDPAAPTDYADHVDHIEHVEHADHADNVMIMFYEFSPVFPPNSQTVLSMREKSLVRSPGLIPATTCS